MSVLKTAWACGFQCRDEPERLTELPGRAVPHVRRTGGEAYTDIDAGTWCFLPISLLKPFVFIKKDIAAISRT
jgi:hypothetical protein